MSQHSLLIVVYGAYQLGRIRRGKIGATGELVLGFTKFALFIQKAFGKLLSINTMQSLVKFCSCAPLHTMLGLKICSIINLNNSTIYRRRQHWRSRLEYSTERGWEYCGKWKSAWATRSWIYTGNAGRRFRRL